MAVIENKPRSASFEARRGEIVDLAAALFANQGYAATGIREIGDAAGLGRGALYYYIESKEALLSEIHDRVMDPLLARAYGAAQSDGNAETRLREVSLILLDLILERKEHVWVFLHEYRSLAGDRREAFRSKRREFEDIIVALLKEGVMNKDFDITDVKGSMLAFLGMHNYTYQWAHEGMAEDARYLSNLYCNVFFSGISARAVGAIG